MVFHFLVSGLDTHMHTFYVLHLVKIFTKIPSLQQV